MNSKKLVSAALTATTVLWMVGAAALVPVASAQTTSSLQAQIAALLAQIQTLQSQLNASGGSTSMTYDFSSDLTVGSTGAQVTALQQFLINKGFLTAVSAPTGYFGSLTQAAVAKFQAANGITPSVGYFGPKTRAFINSMSTTTTGTGTGVTVATGAPLSVTVDSQTPGSTNIAAGAVNTPVLKLDFTAGATPVTVTNLVLTRSGLSQDSDLNNVYLYSGATKLASNLGFNNGAITFSNGAGLFTVPANSTLVVTVTVDVNNGGETGSTAASNSGHIFQIGLASAANVTGGTFTGNYPLESGQFTIASVSNLATLTINNAQQGSATVNAGQLDDLVAQMTVQAGNNPVKVTAVSLTNVGSVTPSYLQNLKLMDGSTQLGATLSSLGSNNIATFDLSGAPLMLTSGQSAVLSLYADITGGVNRTFQFSIQQSSDVQAVDTTYGVGIGASTTVVSSPATSAGFPVEFSSVQINNGGVVASRDPASPTTNVVAGNTNQVLAKFDVLASGDSIKFTQMNFGVTQGSTDQINNFRVVDDQGAQIGTTVNTTGTNAVAEGTGNLNYIIPANTTRVLTVYGDINATSTGSVQVTFGSSGTAAQSYTTYAPAAVSPVPGNTLQILASSTNLVVSLNYGLGTPVSASAGAQQVKIGSYTLTAGQVNPVNLTGVSVQVTSTLLGTYPTWLTNLTVMDGSTQLGQTYATVTSTGVYSFNGNAPILIPANGSVTLDVYANVSSNASTTQTSGGATDLYSVNASTQAGNAVSLATPVPGQDIAFNTGGTLTGSLSAGTSQASQLGMNVPGVNVGQYQFVANNNGGETLTQVTIIDAAATNSTTTKGNASDLINYRLTDTSGNVLSTASEQGGVLTFNLSGLSIPVNSTQYVNLVADTNAYPYATSGGTHAYDLQSYQYTNATNATTTYVARASGMGNLFTIYQTTLNVAGTTGWSTPNSISGVGNTIGEFTFTAGSGNMSPTVGTVTLGAAGSLLQTSSTIKLGLYDASAPSVLLASTTLASTTTSTFNLYEYNNSQWVIPYSSSKTLLVKTLATGGGALGGGLTGGNTGSFQILLYGVGWTDGPASSTATTTADTTPGIGLNPTISLPVPSTNITGLSN